MKKGFSYRYSAPTQEERKEIEDIRKRYMDEEKTQTPVERLRALDNRVRNTATAVGVSVGVVGTLIFGGGLALVLETAYTLWGIVLSAVGAVPTALAYPLYKTTLAKQKRKYGAEIVKLTDELLAE